MFRGEGDTCKGIAALIESPGCKGTRGCVKLTLLTWAVQFYKSSKNRLKTDSAADPPKMSLAYLTSDSSARR